ncbi:MAG TPA: hypothetical protein VLE89_04595 [Chlamydiales bacterium]|nr:hypothetical protein [Chlamydiales bacterium]
MSPPIEISNLNIDPCGICLENDPPPDVLHGNHRFHKGCSDPWVNIEGTCPIPDCGHIINRAVFYARQNALAAEAGLPLLVYAAKYNRPQIVADLAAQGNIPESDRKEAIQEAALQGLQNMVKSLVQTDEHRGIAIDFAMFNHHDQLARTLFAEAENQETTHDSAILNAAFHGHRETVFALIRPDDQGVRDRGLAISTAASKYPDLAQELLNDADDAVFEIAIINAAYMSNKKALKYLNQYQKITDQQLGLVMAFVPADDPKQIVFYLFNSSRDRKLVLNTARARAAENNRAAELEAALALYRKRIECHCAII